MQEATLYISAAGLTWRFEVNPIEAFALMDLVTQQVPSTFQRALTIEESNDAQSFEAPDTIEATLDRWTVLGMGQLVTAIGSPEPVYVTITDASQVAIETTADRDAPATRNLITSRALEMAEKAGYHPIRLAQ